MPSKTARCVVAGLAVLGAAAGVQANSDSAVNDVQALNYALQLEHLEAAFYVRGLAQFDQTAFSTAGFPNIRDYLVLIGQHETAHVNALNSTITSLNGVVGAACTNYSFTTGGFSSVANFLATAITLEDVGVSAYTAALNHITSTGVQQAAATIATVEARHAAYLRDIAGSGDSKVPFPEATNIARLPATVLGLAAPFLQGGGAAGGCTYDLANNLPTVRPGGVGVPVPIGTFSQRNYTSATPSSPLPTYSQAQFDADVAILNYALTLEHLEADFYNTFNGRFNAAAFNAISRLSGQGDAIVTNIGLIRAHENAHVDALTAIIGGRGGSAVSAGCYNWTSITTAEQFLTVAQTLENTGVSAYDGAANQIVDTNLQQIAASVAVVEARHAAYLNELKGQTNNRAASFDTPLSSDAIVSAVLATGYVTNNQLTGCPTSSSTGSRTSGSSSTGSSNPNGSSFVAPIAIVSTLLAVVSALLF